MARLGIQLPVEVMRMPSRNCMPGTGVTRAAQHGVWEGALQMCGINGVFAYRPDAPPVDHAALVRTRDYMSARGPDGKGEWLSPDGRVGFAHRRLSIIDLSDRSSQPMVSADNRLVISFNGEIYNYQALRAQLQREGAEFRTTSDTEVLLHLYARKGAAMLEDLRGMYAFAIWDAAEERLFLARDPFGIKPLYTADDGSSFRFASQVKALLAGGGIDTSIEPAGHVGYFVWGSVPEPWTLYRGIRSLPAGHYQIVDAAGAGDPRVFCSVPEVLGKALAAPATAPRAEALAAIDAAIRDSIEAHHVSDVPVGTFLSAGLDSAMTTAVACAGGSVPHTLTLAFAEFAGTRKDEAPLAEMMAQRFGTNHSTVPITEQEFVADREALLHAMDQPTIDGVNTWFVARAAVSCGMKVALSGLGGDELFASYPTFDDIPKIRRLARPFAAVPSLGRSMRAVVAPLISRAVLPKYAGLIEYGGSLEDIYLLRRSLFMPWELPGLLDPDVARHGWNELRETEGSDRIGSLQRTVADAMQGRDGDSSMRIAISALEMTRYMRNQLLRDSDWASMAHSLELRVPFVDIELLRQTAPWLAAHPGLTKAEIAAKVVPNLPREILDKPKSGFSVPVREWFMSGSAARSDHGRRGWARFLHESFHQTSAPQAAYQ